MIKIVEYYGVETIKTLFHYKNDPALKPSYKNLTSHKYLFLKKKSKTKRFKTRELAEKELLTIK